MKVSLKYLLVIGFLIGITSSWYGQSFQKDIQAVYEAYRKTEQFQTNITITVYNFKEQPVVQKAQIKKSGNNFHYHIGNRAVLMNKKYMLTIDKDQQEIVVADALSPEVLNTTAFGEAEMKEMLEQVDTIIDKGIQNNQHLYIVTSKKNIIEKMELTIDTKYNMLSKVIYHYNEDAGLSSTKVTIDYKGITTHPTFSSAEFSERQYIQKIKGEIQPVSAYKGYEIIAITQEDLND